MNAAGFDVVHELDLACLHAEPGCDAIIGQRGILVGNTRALWPIFLAARREDPGLLASPDPLDAYTERVISLAYPTARVYFAHRMYGRAFLPFTRIAVAAGLGALGANQLVVHPTYGPWFGLRALIALDEPAVRRPPRIAYACTADCGARLAAALPSTEWRDWLAARDACCVGRAYRYSDDQIAYHYTKNLELLT